MTDESFAGSAPASAEPVATPVPEAVVETPQPLGSQTPVAEKPEAKPEPKDGPSKSAGDAIRRANEAVKAKEAEKAKAADAKPSEAPAKPDAKAEPKATKPSESEPEKITPPARRDDGKFAPKEQPLEGDQAGKESNPPRKEEHSPDPRNPYREAPSRFSADAKTAWEASPEPIKAEVHRAIRELEQGHQKYKESAERYDLVREYDELARKNGREGVHESLKQVVEIENAFTRNPIEGFQKIADHFGISLRAVAQHIVGQKPEQVEAQRDNTITSLKQEISQLKQQLGSVTQTIQQQNQKATLSEVQQFAKDSPRFDELADAIAIEIKHGYSLSEAYERADRLNPAPARASPSPVDPVPAQPAPLNPAGQKSISGAPSAGSNPANRKAPASSTREALERAFKRAS